MKYLGMFEGATVGTIFTLLGICFWLPVLIPYSWKRMFFACISLLRLLFGVRIHAMRKIGKYYSVVDDFESRVDSFPDRIQFISADDNCKTTLYDMDVIANKVANWVVEIGALPGDTIGLMLLNSPDLVSFWIGAAKSCLSTALINTNMTGMALLHSITLSTQSCKGPRIIVVEFELYASFCQDVTVMGGLRELNVSIVVWQNLIQVGGDVWSCSAARPPKSLRQELVKENDALLYIFTSGTTGLPKASKISHSRWHIGSLPLSIFCSLKSSDRIYSPLPLYHSAAGVLGVGAALRTGAAMVIRKKFSVSNFSKDCVLNGVTVLQFIGELARFLVHAPASEYEDQLEICTAFGNGMGTDVWEKFQKRYKIANIVEFYASTEGNIGLFNATGRVGSLGFVPRIFDFLYPVKLVKLEPDNMGVPMRNDKGHCIVSRADEVGLMIGEISSNRVDRRFDGYTDPQATKSKIITSVFRNGDRYFNTGDLLYRDKWGFFFWSDRIGDTFRWKGENVATTEVANAIAAVPGVSECCVYGVTMPHNDGRCGMVSIALNDDATESTFSFSDLLAEQQRHLPPYAVCRFVRLVHEIPRTSTFKHQKMDLVRESFDPLSTKNDPVYFYDVVNGQYSKMTSDIHAQISAGKVKL